MKKNEEINEEEKVVEEIVEEVKKEISEEPTKREYDEREVIKERLAVWKPRTEIGRLVKEGKIKDIDEILGKNKILEAEIVDSLLNLKSDLIAIGQSKGKFGGGKRRVWRQTQKKTAEGNVPTFACISVVGDGKGHFGIGYGKSKETLPAREKALRNAKLNIMKIKLGCGSFDCNCQEKHSIPFKVKGRCSGVNIILMPAPQGTGLVVGDEAKKILKLAGIKDIYGRSFGQTRTTINFVKAYIRALENLKEGENE
jgi:small subunit ribosomal protein S5